MLKTKVLQIEAEDIFLAFKRLEYKLREGARPEAVLMPGDTIPLGVSYETDEDGDDYAFMAYAFGKFTYVEIEDRTYGQACGFRIYLGTSNGQGIEGCIGRGWA